MNATSAHSMAAVDYDRRAQLYLAARAGDRTSQHALVEELNELLWRAARRTGLDRESASDVVQTAWLRLWHIEKELEQPRALTKWLLTTVSREAWKQIGHMRREVVADPIDIREEAAIDGVEDVLVRAVEREAVRRAFLAQPERCRRLLAFVATVSRPDYDVIAEALGMKRGSIGPTRGRCLDKLRRTLLEDPSWSGSEGRDEHGA
ncbi:RNA polymerase sigma factor [Glycomyces tritici]|uniref:Sigma-70 family RNA polymerase sigma factor n=1 Tax=Glycomyces tritici TaxID=2665176 RepID=A0ABT7YP20_9ACTN|nr:sigma-70 family RNA polymerase sigma factor [Glycomyces tritici]MDN3240345.1 sigma-70 family RNA polymerase sigma factor [Glycomyces tritici]